MAIVSPRSLNQWMQLTKDIQRRSISYPFMQRNGAIHIMCRLRSNRKYAPDAPNGFMHWGRGVAWAILEQKPDTIFVLTTNYIDGWSSSKKGPDGKSVNKTSNNPRKMAQSLQKMCLDVYGPDKKKWPTINVVVLAKAGRDSTGANRVLSEQFGPIVKSLQSGWINH